MKISRNKCGFLLLQAFLLVQLSFVYNSYGKLTAVKNYAGTLNIMTMVYDALGNKTKKTTYLSDGVTVEKVTVYIREASGSTFTVFEAGQSSPFVGTEVMLEGGSLGVFFPASSTNNYIYSLSDHLSNTRVTIGRDKIGSSAVVLSYSDYYAWGMSMPGREFTTSPKFRLGYQGQEFEASVKMYGFALRMYDQRLGRWHATDPYEQHWSPYLAMSNNPISFVDPDGGWDGGPTGMDPAHNNYLGFGDKTNLQGTTVTATRLNPFFLFDGRPSSAYLFPGYVSVGNVGYDLNKVMAASIEIVRSELANVGAGVNMPDNGYIHYYDETNKKWVTRQINNDGGDEYDIIYTQYGQIPRKDARVYTQVFYNMYGAFGFRISPGNFASNDALNPHEQPLENVDISDLIPSKAAGGVVLKGSMYFIRQMGKSTAKTIGKREARYVFGKGVVVAAKTSTTVLEGAVKSNYGRFVSKIPANSKSSASFQLLDDGNYLFQATSPGKVPGSSALYQKWVNPQGETFKMLKTTFAPDGSIIHVKPK